MTNISEPSDQEKSVMLAKLCGWWVTKTGFIVLDDDLVNLIGSWPHVEGNPIEVDLYEPRYMALAWRVLNWAFTQEHAIDKDDSAEPFFVMDGVIQWSDVLDYYLDGEDDNAQRLWLDKILSLAIEGGMVK